MPNIVYVLSNPAIPGIVKVGMTDRPDVQRRMSDLHTTGVPLPFDCLIAREIEDREAANGREPGTPNSMPRRSPTSVEARSCLDLFARGCARPPLTAGLAVDLTAWVQL